MLHTRGIYKILGIAPGTVARMRSNLRKGTNICLDTKHKYLLKAGFIKVRETSWIVLKESSAKKTSELDYLRDFEFLTLLGRINGFNDSDIKRINKDIIDNPEVLRSAYKRML